MKGKVINIKPLLKHSRLKICGKIETGEQGCIDAILPAREMAAILPRNILIGDAKKASVKLLETIQSIAARLTLGRIVRVWKYNEEYYFTFIAWSDVHFDDQPDSQAEDSCPGNQ